ncbi:MAG: 2-oxo-hepta-3-ene-1,7-dioic acid hydratase [Beijerinckiaceae bacterium]|jgi:2-oxo-hept-3-ene-1,7-dioate hydratase|nr:2-oxo-hepta-3-ene-1,7-dioic acid hydratase [Beijerinckiaceae bacterium]
MLSDKNIQIAARKLDAAERTRKQIGILSLEYPALDMASAYAIQQAWVDIKIAAGRSVWGHKIGLTSKAMQNALNIDMPDSGVLFDDMFFQDAGDIPSSRFIETRIEAELAFILKSRLSGPNCSIFDVLNATDYVTPALEILDTRIVRVDPETKATRTVFDTISDNAANAGIVLGGRAMRPQDTDLRWVGSIVSRNGKVEETGLAGGVLNNPAMGIAWLAARMSEYGKALEPGQVVLAGSFIRPIEARKGDTIFADYGPWGTVSCYFA